MCVCVRDYLKMAYSDLQENQAYVLSSLLISSRVFEEEGIQDLIVQSERAIICKKNV